MRRFIYDRELPAWYDMEKMKYFIPEVRESFHKGGWFSYNDTRSSWVEFSAKTMYNTFFDPGIANSIFGSPRISTELLISNNLNFSGIKDKSVLVIGGGPSLGELKKEQLEHYDYIFSCNQFFRHPILKDVKINLVLLGDEVNLQDKDLVDYIKKYNPVFGFEHSDKRATLEIAQFKENNSARVFSFLTRYFSRLGYLPRAMILAKLFGATKIDYIGFDGFVNNPDNHHSFEKRKGPPPFNDDDKFLRQAVIFWSYFLYDLGAKDIEVNNLGKNSKFNSYKGIRDNVEAELNEANK